MSEETPTETKVKPSENIKAAAKNQPVMPKVYVAPERLTPVADGEKVMLIERIVNRIAYRSKQCVDINRTIQAYIRELERSGIYVVINCLHEINVFY